MLCLPWQMKTLGTPSPMEKEEEKKGMGPDEETFNIPVPLSQKVCILGCTILIGNYIYYTF